MNKNTIDVYWAIASMPERSTLMNLMWEPPKPLVSTLPQKDIANYHGCKAMNSIYKNTFVLTHCMDDNVSIINNQVVSESNSWQPHGPAFKNAHTVEYDHSWLFFCDEPLVMELTPPFMHKTSVSKFGFLTAGGFDISRWYRIATMTYQLWEGIDAMQITKDEAMAYIHFKTDKKVVLHQYEITPELIEVALSSVKLKEVMPNLSLDNIYHRFTSTNRHKKVSKLIKQNILN
jgi:hypothetical protein